MPDLPVALCSDRALGPEDILIEQPEADVGARSQKVRIYDLAPAEWQYVLYLDADTVPVQPMDSLFGWLQDGWEFIITKNPQRFAVTGNMLRPDNHAECKEIFDLWGSDKMMQLFGGMFAFRRCEATRILFADWVAEWGRYGKRDQGALLRAYWHHPLRLLCLTNRWNLDPKYESTNGAVLLHYPMEARRWSGIIAGRADSPEAWGRVAEWERLHGLARVTA